MLRKILLIIFVALALYSVAQAQTSSDLARKFDEFGDIEASNLIARLDNLAVQVKNEPERSVICRGSVTGMRTT